MINNYNCLRSGRDTLLKNGIGETVGSPPISGSKAMTKSWLAVFVLLLSLTFGHHVGAQTLANYAYSTGTNGSLEDLSTGATTIMTGRNDDLGGTVTAIGFNFPFMGQVYSHFSANSNGQMLLHTSAGATAAGSQESALVAGRAILSPMSGDNEVGNGIRIRVFGTAPNRKLVVEWNQFTVGFVDVTNAGNMQVWLDEATGAVTYIYGELFNASSSSQTRSIFIASSNTATTAGSVTLSATPTFALGTTLASNTIAAGSGTATASPLIANLGSAAQGSRRFFTFTPTQVSVADPITLTFTAVGSAAITVNWIDNSTNESSFAIIRATDAGFTQGLTVLSVTSTTGAATGGAYNSVQTGLIPGTTYFYRIQAVSGEASVSSPGLTGSQSTTAGATYFWVGASGGTWGTAANWNTNPAGGGSTRTTPAATDILIVDGAGTTPGGSLIISHDVAGQTIGQFRVTSNTTLSLQSSITTTRTTTISGGGGDDLVVEAGSTLQLINAANACAFAFSGTGNTGLIAGTYNAAGSTSNVITTTGGTGTLVTVTGSVNNNIAGASGCLLGSAATLAFGANSNYLHGSFTSTNGFIPLATWDTTSTVTITGGTSSTGITNPTQSFGNFVFNSTTLTGSMSVWGTGTTAVIKGNLTISATGSGAALFRATTSGLVTVNGNLNINGTSTFQVGNNSFGTVAVLGNTTIASLARLDLNSGVLSQRGTTFTNNGTLTGTAAASNLQFFSPTNVAQTFNGTGTVLTNIGSLSLLNTSGLTISTTNPIITLRVNLFNGTITGSNLITIGTGAALNTVVQIGYTGNVLAGGSFDVAPTYNLGTGTHGVFYGVELAARTTGFEIPPSRSLGFLNTTNVGGVVIAGGNLGVGTLTFGAGTGNITTNASNVLTVTGTTVGSVVRTSLTAYVNGPLALTLPASLATGSTYTFPIGKGTINTFALVNPTTNAGGTVTVQAEAFDGDAGGTPGLNISAISNTKYWAASITAGAANFTNSLIQLNDATAGRDAIAASATSNGAYDLQGGVTVTTTPTTMTTTAPANTTLPGFFLLGNKAAANFANLVISPAGNQCTNVARTITVDVTPGGGAVTGVVINYSINGVAQTAITMSNTTNNGGLATDTWSGVIPTVTPVNGTVAWSVTATDANTLVQTQSGVTYRDEPLLGFASSNASASTICAGASTTLTAVLSSPGVATIGTQTTTEFGGSVYRHGFGSGDFRHQLIYTAAELTAAGVTAGNLTSIAFNVTSLGSGAYTNFTISLGSASAATAVSAFQSVPLTQVFTQASFTPVSGVNTHTFQTPFSWNGTSDVLVNICYTVASASATSTLAATTPATSRNSQLLGTAGACTAVSGTTFANRPLATFGFNPAPAITSVSWFDGTTSVSGNPVVVSPTSSTTYVATINAAGCSISPAGLNIVVNPLPTAPAAGVTTNSCGIAVPLVSVTDPNGFTTPTFRWYATNEATTPLQASTSATYTTAISATTTFFVSVVNPTTGCESLRTPITATVDAATAIDAIANQAVCANAAFSVTATSANSAYSYTWTASPATGSGIATSLTGASQSITPTAAGTYTYTVTATDGVCNAITTFTATVTGFPVLTSATATPAAVCANGISTLTAVQPLSPASYAFAATAGTYTPITGTTLGATALGDDVGIGNLPIGFTFNYGGVPQTVFAASSNGLLLLGNTSPTITGFSANALPTTANAISAFWDDNNTANGSIIYATTGTAPNRVLTVQWTNMNVGGTGSTTTPTLSMQARLFENGTVQFVYGPRSAPLSSPTASVGLSGAVGQYLSVTPLSPIASSTVSSTVHNSSVTDVNIPVGTTFTFTPPVANAITWAPTTELFTDAAATVPYTGGNASTVYSRPTATRTYNATVAGTAGCNTVSSNVVVTQNADAVTPITGGATAVCLGTTTIPAVVDFDTTTEGVTWTSSNPAVATIDANGIVTPLTAGVTTIGGFVNNTTTGCVTNLPNTIALNVFSPVAITSNPASQNIEINASTQFSVAATGSNLTYQWFSSTNGVTFTTPVTNDAVYSGATSPILVITDAPLALSGTSYRCEITGSSPCLSPVISESALLTVELFSVTNPASQTLCSTSGTATFTVTTTGTFDSIVWEVFDTNDWIVIDDQNLTVGGLTFGGDVFSTSLVVNGITTANNNYRFRVNLVSDPTVVTSAEAVLTVNPIQTVVTSGPSAVQDRTICFNAVNSSTFTVVSSGGTGFQWQYSANGSSGWQSVVNNTPAGANYLNATGATLTVNSTAALAVGTYFYRCLVSGPAGCPTTIESNTAQLNVVTPTITAVASVPTICGTGSSVLTASGAGTGGTYVWTAAPSLAAPLNVATVTATPTATTTYTVTGTTTAGCINSGTVTVIVSPAITAAALATPSVVCLGGDSQLQASYTPLAIVTPASYIFAGSTGTYTPITGGTVSTAVGDDVTQAAIPIGFNFTYNGTVFTDFGLSTNGHIRLGTGTPAGLTNALATTTVTNTIAPLWDDNDNTTGTIRYEVTGLSPNRVLTIQWANVSIGGSGSNSNPVCNFQVQLFETTNLVRFNYGNLVPNTLSASIGITGATGNFLSVTPGSPASASTVSSVTANNGISSVANIPTGTSYTFTPVFPTINYSWSPTTFLSNPNIANPIAQAVTTPTTYNVTVTSSTGCSDTETVTVAVSTGIAISTQPADASFCQGATATLSVGANGSGLIYQWRRNGVDLFGEINSSITIPNATPANSGNYDVIITDGCGGTPVTSSVAVLTITPTPTVNAPAAWPSTVCAGTATAAVPLTGSAGAVFNITGGAAIGLANQTGVTSIPSFTGIAGTATLVITPTSGTCTGTPINYTVTIQALPAPVTVTPTAATLCSNANPVLLTGAGGFIPSEYCIPSMIIIAAGGDFINNFSFAGIVNNNSGDAATDYTYYSSLTANVVAGVSNPVTLQAGGTASLFAQQFRIWVDMNQNGIFETTESVFNTTTATFSPNNATGNITIPVTAFNGVTRMRVASRFSSQVGAGDSCLGQSNFGEYEDYNISITGGTNPPQPLYVWSSQNGGLFTDAAGTVPYNGTTPRATIFARPSATGTVIATFTNAAGCQATASSTITINPAPATSAIVGTTTACAGSTASYSVANTAGSTYAWTITGGTQASGTNTNSITVTWGAAGAGSVSVVETNAATCVGSAVTLPVTVGAQPVWYTDADNDNYPSSAATVTQCARPLNGKLASELTALTVDCNDNNPGINPGATEICWNGVDENCNGLRSEGCAPVVVNMATANNTVLPSFATGVAAQAYSFAGATTATYRFTIVNLQTLESQEVTSPTRFITIPLSMRNFNISYSVTAAAVIDGENVPYAGNTITVLSPIVPLVKLTP
ncbi:GEVED domain-containing protein, partial [Flavobacterium sp. j3]